MARFSANSAARRAYQQFGIADISMTVRKFGQQRGLTALPLAAAMIAVGAASPIAAQQTETPAPTPAPSSIFRLPPADDGRAPGVQGPSDNGDRKSVV